MEIHGGEICQRVRAVGVSGVDAEAVLAGGRATPTGAGHRKLDGFCRKSVLIACEMDPYLIDQITSVVFDGAARAADEMKMVVGMGHLPSGRVGVCAKAGLSGDAEIGEQNERSIDRGPVGSGVEIVDAAGDLLGGQMTIR